MRYSLHNGDFKRKKQTMKSKMKSWQEWLLFSSVMILVFML